MIHRFPPLPCPHCGKTLNAAGPPDDTPLPPPEPKPIPGLRETIAKAADYDRLTKVLIGMTALLDSVTVVHKGVIVAPEFAEEHAHWLGRMERGLEFLATHIETCRPSTYTCPACGATSQDPNEYERKYCGHCHLTNGM